MNSRKVRIGIISLLYAYSTSGVRLGETEELDFCCSVQSQVVVIEAGKGK
jgi:hypothetical protein